MKRTEWLQETRKMRFEEAYEGWTEKRLTQEEAAKMLGLCSRSFRRYLERYRESGMDGLVDKRLEQVSHRCAPVDEVMRLTDDYSRYYRGWNVKHYYSHYKRAGGGRSYSWVKSRLQTAALVPKIAGKGKHRKRRVASPFPGMMIHQDGSTHEWVPQKKWDLIVTMDDATNEHYSMFFVEQEGTVSSLQGVKEVIEQQGLFCSFYSDRGSHYWHTPEAGGKVDKSHPTQFGRALKRLGIEQIAAYSPEARGRSERAFRTHQGRLPKELALAGITEIEAANHYIKTVYRARYNEEFSHPAQEKGSAFVPFVGHAIDEILCEQFERTVSKDNCVSFEGLTLQLPSDKYRMHYMRVKVKVRRYLDGGLALFHGPRRLSDYDIKGQIRNLPLQEAA
jgi:transposase